MSAAARAEFVSWLSELVTSWGGDGAVLAEYLTAVVSGDEPAPEKREALADLVASISADQVDQRVDRIVARWAECRPSSPVLVRSPVDVEERLARLLGSQTLAAAPPRCYTEDERKIKENILRHYGRLPDDDDEDEHQPTEKPESDDLVRNTNATNVAAAARERREAAKLESQRKKDRDKEDREKQKQLKDEKKEKRKTHKGERKR